MNVVAVMTSDAAHGTMIAQRTTLRPKNSLDRNWATPRLTSMVSATTATTQIDGVAQHRAERGVVQHVAGSCPAPAVALRSPVME